MIGIIYKLTIIAKYKMDGHHPFYIGQHWCKSKEDLGGCNVIIGAAIEVSPTLDPIVANKISKKKRDFYKTERGLEIRKKLSEIRIGNADWAKKVSIGLRKSDNFHNAVRSEEHRKKMSEIAKKRLSISENHPMFGKHHSEESKRILREKNLGKSLSDLIHSVIPASPSFISWPPPTRQTITAHSSC